MTDFYTYFELGMRHILDIRGIDHILFILVLCLAYDFSKWVKILILLTAFTLGHTLTLFLNSFNLLILNHKVVEFLIPISIIISALANIFNNGKKQHNSNFSYALVLFFGLIHGLGFAGYFSSLVGKSNSILMPLLSFNVGLEVGQILFVLIIFSILAVLINVFKAKYFSLNYIISAWVGGYATLLAIQSYPY